MAAFSFNTLTQGGSALIAQATAANPIVFVESKSKSTAATDDADLAGKPLSWYDGKSGAIASCSAYTDQSGNHVARVVAKYTNEGSTQIAKSVCITARLASQTDANAIVFAAISDPNSAVELPGSGAIGAVVEFPFNFAINATNTVSVTPGSSASVADLDRFVSLHSAGNPNVGEGQTVLGTKTFPGIVKINDLRTGYIAANVGDQVIFDADIIPQGDDFYLGNEDQPWTETRSYDFYVYRTLYFSDDYNTPEAHGSCIFRNTQFFGQSILADGSGTHNIGESASPFNNVYAVNLHATTTLHVYGEIDFENPDENVTVNGSCDFADDQYFGGNILAFTQGTHSIGIQGRPFDNIYAISLYGNHKSLYQVNDPVGGMYEIMVKISVTAYTASTPQTLSLLRDGQEIYVGMPLTASGVTAEISGIYNPLGADYTSTWRFCMIQALIVDVSGTGDVLMHRPYVSGDMLALAIHTGSGRP